MAELGCTYLGIELRNPIIVAASGITGNVEGVKKAAAAGAGAVVLKSLFEEQLRAEISAAESLIDSHPEAEAFFERAGMEEGARAYLDLVKGSVGQGVPVIASVNCVGSSRWAEFARRIEEAGAKALELNMAFLPANPGETGASVEARLLAAFAEVRAATKLPLSVKLGQSYASLPNLGAELSRLGAQGLVLFNRFYRFDVDLQAMAIKAGPVRSGPEDYHETLRWIALLSGRFPLDLAAATGVHDGETALKLLAAGAGAVQVCSVIYRRGFGVIGEMCRTMDEWLGSHGLASVQDLKGRVSQSSAADPAAFTRLQYIQALTGIS